MYSQLALVQIKQLLAGDLRKLITGVKGWPTGDPTGKEFTKFTQLHVVTSEFVMVAHCARGSKIELDPD